MPYDEIRARMDELSYRQVDLANLLGLDPTAISKAFTGRRRFKAEEMDKIRAWLSGDAAPIGTPVGMIPVLAKVSAGGPRDAMPDPKGYMPKPDPSIPDGALALDVEGDSMDQIVPDGGRIIYDPNDRALWPRRFYVVINEHGETTFKRFLADPARLEPCSNNPRHEAIVFDGSVTFTIVGRVLWQASPMPS